MNVSDRDQFIVSYYLFSSREKKIYFSSIKSICFNILDYKLNIIYYDREKLQPRHVPQNTTFVRSKKNYMYNPANLDFSRSLVPLHIVCTEFVLTLFLYE